MFGYIIIYDLAFYRTQFGTVIICRIEFSQCDWPGLDPATLSWDTYIRHHSSHNLDSKAIVMLALCFREFREFGELFVESHLGSSSSQGCHDNPDFP